MTELRKTVPVTVLVPNPDLEVGVNAFVFRGRTDTESVRWYIAVTNRSATRECGIQLSDIVLKDAGGNDLVTEGIDFLTGNIGQRNSASWSSTCLDPGGAAPVLGIDLSEVYSEVVSIEVGSLSSTPNSEAAPPAIIRATSYATIDGDPNEFEITVENTGSGAAFVDGARYVLFGESGDPLWWSLADGETRLAPGETFELTDTIIVFRGTSSLMHVYVDFDAVP